MKITILGVLIKSIDCKALDSKLSHRGKIPLDSKEHNTNFHLQHIVDSLVRHLQKPTKCDTRPGIEHFFDFDHDPFQQRVELFKELSRCRKRRQIRPVLRQFGVRPNRFYE